MADQKLTQLTALASLSADDLFYVVDDPAGAANSRKMAASVLDGRYLQVANNLSDLNNAATARTNLGLVAGGAGDIWVEKAGDTMTGELVYAEPAGATHTFYSVDPVDPDARSFNWNITTITQAGRDNVIINWGYNNAVGGGPEDTTDATFYKQLETDYPSGGGDRRMEYHWDFFVSGGADPGVRPMHMNLDKNTGLVDLNWYTDTFTWLSAHNGSFGMMGLNSGATALLSELRVYVPSSFEQELHFSGTTHAGLRLNSLTTTQKNALTPAAGMLLYDSTLTRMQGYIAGAWATLYSAGGTDVAIADGGTGQSTAQLGINALTNVAAATNEHVLTKDTATGNAIFKAAAGGGGTPGGVDTQIQFNDGGAFGGDADLVWNKTSNLLTVTGLVNSTEHYQIDALRALHFTAGGCFVGSQAGNLTISGVENVGVGGGALVSLTTGENNTGIGSLALSSLTSGSNNVAIGRRVLGSFTGNNAVAVGVSTLDNLTTGANCVAIGRSAGQAITTSGNLTAFGTDCLKNATGADNTAIGFNAGAGVITGAGCTIIGSGADATVSSVVASIAIGVNAKVAASYTMSIGSDHSSGNWPINQIIQNLSTEGNAIQNAFVLNGTSYNTPVTGHGVAILAKLESSTTTEQSAGRVSWEWATATHASRKARAKWTVYDTAERECIRIEADGAAPMIGFLGAAAVARQAAYTQTYSTATRTFSAYTSDPESAAYTGIDNAQAGTVYATVADLNQLRVAYETLRVFAENVGQLINSLIDDGQSYGLLA